MSPPPAPLPRKLSFKTEQDYRCYLQRLEDYRNYRARWVFIVRYLVLVSEKKQWLRHREKCRAQGRQQMAHLRAKSSDDQCVRHREAQARYREKCFIPHPTPKQFLNVAPRNREWLAHKARLAAETLTMGLAVK
jgi:hypothetical protein